MLFPGATLFFYEDKCGTIYILDLLVVSFQFLP